VGGGGGELTTFALTAYPLSGPFRRDLEAFAGGPIEIAVLPELRRLGPAGLLRRLRSLQGRCLLPIEDPGSAVLLPILQALAAVTRATTIEVVQADLSMRHTSRLRGVAGVAGLAAASIDSQRALRAAHRDVTGLLHTSRQDAHVDGNRVLFLNANLWFGVKAGGSVAHVAGVANAFVSRGYDVTLATAPDPVGVTAEAAIRRLETPDRFGLPVESNLYRFGRSVPAQTRDVQGAGFVYQRHSVGSYAGAVVSRRAGVPLVLEYNGSEVWVARNWGRPLRYEQLALDAQAASLRHAHLVVTVSEPLANELLEQGVEPDRVVWHPNGVDADRFDPARFSEAERVALRDRYGIPHDAVLVTFVGTFGQWHGVDVLASAIRTDADRWRRAGVHFLLVGDGLKMPDVRRELAGVDGLATLTGLVAQDDAPLHVATSDILVSPHVANADGSPFFGSPTKLFEYMAAGKAIVASDLDQIGDVLRDDLAVLVAPGDVDGLVRGLRTAIENPARRHELGARARERVLERYTWGHHVDTILDALARVTR
jgi:glycosyltransferase involved in cell wall biosynthesis